MKVSRTKSLLPLFLGLIAAMVTAALSADYMIFLSGLYLVHMYVRPTNSVFVWFGAAIFLIVTFLFLCGILVSNYGMFTFFLAFSFYVFLYLGVVKSNIFTFFSISFAFFLLIIIFHLDLLLSVLYFFLVYFILFESKKVKKMVKNVTKKLNKKGDKIKRIKGDKNKKR